MRTARRVLPIPGVKTRWPLFLCAFVSIASATAAFLESPLARHPSVVPYTAAIDGIVRSL